MKRSQVTPKVLHKAAELYLEGVKAPQIQKLTGLDHSQSAYVRYVLNYFYRDGGTVVEATPANVAALYDYFRVSVGGIMTMLGTADDGLWAYSAADVERLYQQATGYTLKGQRCDKGGAFLKGDRKLYEDSLKPTGTKLLPTEVTRAEARAVRATEALAVREAMALEVAQLDADIKAFGAKPKGTKALKARQWAELKAAATA